jgi:hypothetical protein
LITVHNDINKWLYIIIIIIIFLMGTFIPPFFRGSGMTAGRRIHVVLALNFILTLSLEMAGTSELFVFTENFNVTTEDVGTIGLFFTVPRLVYSAWISPAVDASTSSWMLISTLAIMVIMRVAMSAAIVMHSLLGFLCFLAAGGAISIIMEKRMMLLLEHVVTQASTYYKLETEGSNSTTSIITTTSTSMGSQDRETLMGKMSTRLYALSNAAMALADVFYFLLRYYEITVQQANVLSWIFSCLGLAFTTILVLFMQPMLQDVEDTHVFTLHKGKRDTIPDPFCCCSSSSSERGLPWRQKVKQAWEDTKNPLIWRMVIMQVILQGSYSVFGYIKIGLSTVLLHFYGDRVPFPLVEAINPTMVMVFSGVASFVIPRSWSTYTLILLGTCVAPLSLIPVMINPENILFYIYFIIIFSMGEVVWSPRVNAYTQTKAPRHCQATFLALVSIPVSVISMAVSWVTYWLTGVYCSKASTCRETRHLWIIVFVGTLMTPIGLFLFRRWLQRSPEEDLIQRAATERILPNNYPEEEGVDEKKKASTLPIIKFIYT